MKRVLDNYAVDVLGNVYSMKTKKKMSQRTDKRGYKTIRLNGKKEWFVHRLVCMAYLPNPDNLETVNHKNFVTDDNRLENLEWMSMEDNINHSKVNKPYRDMPKLSKRRQIWLCELYKGNRSVSYLSELFCMSTSRVTTFLTLCGAYEVNKTYYDIDYDKVFMYINSSVMSNQEIADAVGCTRAMINYLKRKNNLPEYPERRNKFIVDNCKTVDSVNEFCFMFRLSRSYVKGITGLMEAVEIEYGITDLVLFEKLVKDKLSRAELENRFKCGSGAVDTALKRVGLRIITKKHDYDKIKQLREKGLSYAKVADKLDIPVRTLIDICQRQGWGGTRGKVGNLKGINQYSK